jgi:hypothetical protein
MMGTQLDETCNSLYEWTNMCVFAGPITVYMFITIHKSLPLVPVLGQNNPVHAFENHLMKNPYNITLPLRHRSSTLSLLLSFPHQNAPILSLIHATRPRHLIPLYLMAQMIFFEEFRWWSSTLCTLIQCVFEKQTER